VKSRSSGGISRDNSQGSSYDLIAQRLTVATFLSAVIRLALRLSAVGILPALGVSPILRRRSFTLIGSTFLISHRSLPRFYPKLEQSADVRKTPPASVPSTQRICARSSSLRSTCKVTNSPILGIS